MDGTQRTELGRWISGAAFVVHRRLLNLLIKAKSVCNFNYFRLFRLSLVLPQLDFFKFGINLVPPELFNSVLIVDVRVIQLVIDAVKSNASLRVTLLVKGNYIVGFVNVFSRKVLIELLQK